jgi:hypothetical protein
MSMLSTEYGCVCLSVGFFNKATKSCATVHCMALFVFGAFMACPLICETTSYTYYKHMMRVGVIDEQGD